MKQQPEIKEKLMFNVTMLVSVTLCISVIAMVFAFLYGLYVKQIDNHEIFKMLSPAFQTLIGGMIGFLSGVKVSTQEDK